MDDTLGPRQAAFARMLADRMAPLPAALAGFAEDALGRTREVLQRKRVENALPLLPRLAAHGDALGEVARGAVDATPRPARGAALADAMHIAARALSTPRLAADARVDLLVLRARFRFREGVAPAPRRAPFVGTAESRQGRRVWVLKGLGAEASVRLIETRNNTP